MRVYLDSSALLKRIIDEPESEQLRVQLCGHADRNSLLLSSQLASIEVSRAIRMRFNIGYAAAADFVDDALSGVAEHAIGDEIASLSQRLNPHRLRSLDAIHVASAILLNVDLLITYDDRIAKAGELNGLRCAAPGS
jgi:predicted nucleic acid-binding protein